jgi:hypothetical protein
MTARARSRTRDRVLVAAAGVLSAALFTSVLIGTGPSWTALPPLACTSMAISVAEGAVGEPSPEAALERWLDQGASPLTPRFGWVSRPADGFVFMINGAREIEISDLSSGSGSGWMVTATNCV